MVYCIKYGYTFAGLMGVAFFVSWCTATSTHSQELWAPKFEHTGCGFFTTCYYRPLRKLIATSPRKHHARPVAKRADVIVTIVQHQRCSPTVIDVLSTEHSNEDSARDAAIKLWKAKTQWKLGGHLMDIENAADIRWRCGASNAHDTFSGKWSETTNKLIGGEGQNVRCELWARPCPAEFESGNKRGRR